MLNSSITAAQDMPSAQPVGPIRTEKKPVACGHVAGPWPHVPPYSRPAASSTIGILTDGGCMLYEPNDPQTLAKTLAALLKDRARLRQMGHAGKAAVMKKLDIRQTARRMTDIGQQII